MAALKKKKTAKKSKVASARGGSALGGKKKIGVKKAVIRKTKAKISKKIPASIKLIRASENPIIQPMSNSYWESKATFNPSAIYHDGKVHVIYRAIGDSDISVLGYAKSDDGISIDQNSKSLAYYKKSKDIAEKNSVSQITSSGGGWGGGCEDPRLTLLGDRVYMIYTAFDGWGSLRLTLTSIRLEDFISKRFYWTKPVLISPPGQINKNWVLFPEKINGKYAILHSISPAVKIDYFNSLDELGGTKFIESVHQDHPLWNFRDGMTRGIAGAPIKTKYGWLALYHKIEKHDPNRYKLWAMILDSKDPAKILYKGERPILEPDEEYENQGYKSGTVYSCGAVVKDGKLFVYYGGADKVSCVATADLDKFLKEMIKK